MGRLEDIVYTHTDYLGLVLALCGQIAMNAVQYCSAVTACESSFIHNVCSLASLKLF